MTVSSRVIGLVVVAMSLAATSLAQTGGPASQPERRKPGTATRSIDLPPGRNLQFVPVEDNEEEETSESPAEVTNAEALPPKRYNSNIVPDAETRVDAEREEEQSGHSLPGCDLTPAREIIEALTNDTEFNTSRAVEVSGGYAGFEPVEEQRPAAMPTSGKKANKPKIQMADSGEAVLETCPVIPIKTIQFDFAQNRLTDCAQKQLEEVRRALQAPDIRGKRIYIVGNTDDIGDHNVNLTLSRERAEAVRDYLVSEGIEANRLAIDYHGATRPLRLPMTDATRENADDPARVANRRVDFIKAEDAAIMAKLAPQDRRATKVTRALNGRRYLNVDFVGRAETGVLRNLVEGYPASNITEIQIQYSVLESCHIYVICMLQEDKQLLWMQARDLEAPNDNLRLYGRWVLRGEKHTQTYYGTEKEWLTVGDDTKDALVLLIASREPFSSPDELGSALQRCALTTNKSGGEIQQELLRSLGRPKGDQGVEVAALWFSR